MLEIKIEKTVTDYAESFGWLQYKSELMEDGVPDRIYMKGGVVFFIEFKQKGKKPRPNQIVQANKIIYQGGIPVYVADNINDGKHIIDKYEEAYNAKA